MFTVIRTLKMLIHTWWKNWATVTEFILIMICQIFYVFRDRLSHDTLISANFNIKMLLRLAKLMINQKAVISRHTSKACIYDLLICMQAKNWEIWKAIIWIRHFNNLIIRLLWLWVFQMNFIAAASWSNISKKIIVFACSQFFYLIAIECSRAAW